MKLDTEVANMVVRGVADRVKMRMEAKRKG